MNIIPITLEGTWARLEPLGEQHVEDLVVAADEDDIWTWLAKQARRTPINTECKYLLLRYAFEEQGAIRVQLKTNAKNERSRTAILRIGAQFEGILRQQFILPDGAYRDSAYYSIIDTEWPAVRERLERMLAGEPSAVMA